ncbi:MAG: ABC transporter ATP-binding protein [Clostridiales bacterium]|nr:ABC transporter ATP-binding protein [Clostridiales bacterium]
MNRRGAIQIENLDKYFGENHVVNHISLSVEPGEFISLLGPSGCGKTTILRMIAGFETIDGGDIRIDGESIIHLPPHKRALNTVFQQYALFPHMNVYDNVAYGLHAANVKKGEIRERVQSALETVQLGGFEERMPSQMSGGQKQRVSIARAIVNRPPVLLLDEPLTALDMKLRKEMRYELRSIQQRLGITFLYVTHDQEEAMIMSDRIAVLNGGNVEQMGKPEEIYRFPKSAFVSDFIGETNAFDGIVRAAASGFSTIECESGFFRADAVGFREGEFVNVSIRPHEVKWQESAVEGFRLQGIVKDFIFTGSFVNAIAELPNGREVRIARLAGTGLPQIGQQVFLYWNPEDAVVMKNQAGDVNAWIEDMDLGEWIQK